MPRFGKAYMRPKKLARRGDGPSTSGESGPAPVRVLEAVGMTEEVPAVGTTKEAAIEMPEEVLAPVDVPEAAACAMETEEVVALVDVPEAAVEMPEEVVALVDVLEAAACAMETEEVVVDGFSGC